jgi:hypothetical protein
MRKPCCWNVMKFVEKMHHAFLLFPPQSTDAYSTDGCIWYGYWHTWFLWPSCAIYCAFHLVEHVHEFWRERSHEYASDMWVVPSMWLQYGELPCVLLEWRHLWQWQAWPNCTHPGCESSSDSTCPPNAKYVFARFLPKRMAQGAHAILMRVAPCT